MTGLKKIWNIVKVDVDSIFGKIPKNLTSLTAEIAEGLEALETALKSNVAITVALMFKNGATVLTALQTADAEALAVVQSALGCEAAVASATTPAAKADAIITCIQSNLKGLPAAWQKKHFVEIGETLLAKLGGIPTTEANMLITLALAKIETETT